jgi:probable HAF family extracellular repeat protein
MKQHTSISTSCAVLALAALICGCAGGAGTTPNLADAHAPAAAAASVPQYHVVALGSLGGGLSAGISDNNQSWLSGYSLLSGNATVHAALWYAGSNIATDLRTLGGTNSAVEWPNHTAGSVIGISQIATADPLGEQWSCSYPAGGGFLPYTGQECRGFIWTNGTMTPLPTLGGNNGFASGSNAIGQTVGWAETNAHDATCVAPQVLGFQAVMWDRSGAAHALAPLGSDPDSAATAINDRGDAVGISGICQNAVGNQSAARMVLWRQGVPMSIPTLGGAAWNTPEMIDDAEDVVGFSDLPGDQNGAHFNGHAFLWTSAAGTKDLGVLSGDAVSFAYSVNNRGQIVGQSCTAGCGSSRAFLYQNGTMYDLNALLDPASAAYDLIFANDINDEGQIAGLAVDTGTGAIVAFRLVAAGTTPAQAARRMTARPMAKYHVRMGPFGRPIVSIAI